MHCTKQSKLWVFCCILCAVCGCDSVDGTDPYAIWKTYQDPDELFHFHYLSPPWEKDLRDRQAVPIYVVEPHDEPLPVLGMPGDAIGARLSLQLEVTWDATPQDVSAADIRDWEAAGAEAEEGGPFQNRAGDPGLRVSAEAPDRWFTVVYFELDGDGVVAMQITGNRDDLQSDDIALLLRGLEPRPAEGE